MQIRSKNDNRKTKLIFHMLGNAHIDPVWLWDWREGLNEGLITCRTVLELMDEDKELTFNRGESVVYEHIEKTDHKTFLKIKKYVYEGRWDVVGGTYLQSDHNLPETETLIRQFVRGQNYFKSHFGKYVKVAWAADCFGHSAGLPDIMASAGIKYFAFTRPDKEQFFIPKPAFVWIGKSGSRILAYRPVGWYGTNRDEINQRLNETLQNAQSYEICNVGIFYGLGNHGGGPTRRQVREIRIWAENHPEVKVIFSTFHRFFDALENEIKNKEKNFLPEVKGELGFCLRGCYSSVAKFKFKYRKAQAHILRAEKTTTAISILLGNRRTKLSKEWDKILFNGFHDILPGTSIERAMEEQLEAVSGSIHDTKSAEFSALNILASKIDTTVKKTKTDMPSNVPMLIWNPHPHKFNGFVEMEACLDWRPILKYKDCPDKMPILVQNSDGKIMPFQNIKEEHNFCPDTPWRKRVLVPVKIPPMGWSILQIGWMEGATHPPQPPKTEMTSASDNSIYNSIFTVKAIHGESGIKIFKKGKPFLEKEGLSVILFEDNYGSWGAAKEEEFKTKEYWIIKNVRVLERGPWRSSIWVRLSGKKSRIDLTINLYAACDLIEFSARAFCDTTSSRLKLIMPFEAKMAEYESPGASIIRTHLGEVPACRWVRVFGNKGTNFSFVSDAISNFNLSKSGLDATIFRASAYAKSGFLERNEIYIPPSESGELKFKFILTSETKSITELADKLEQPLITLLVPSKGGKLSRTGSILGIDQKNISLLCFKAAEDGNGFILRLMENDGKKVTPSVKLLHNLIKLNQMKPYEIKTWRIIIGKSYIKKLSCNALEQVV